ncbi:hypothetical protein BDB00DRAFT_742010, partial [Zychaea mexicana]|uniref:uncharacterized protein n=1 Tax=Zychaea mexicana TaxID=64656 RepID=UPI0022FE04BF
RLDLRLVSTTDDRTKLEAITGEFASDAATNESKLYYDKLKSVAASKVHLNHTLRSMPYITPSQVQFIRLTIVQVMSLTCYIYCLTLVDKKVYCLDEI